MSFNKLYKLLQTLCQSSSVLIVMSRKPTVNSFSNEIGASIEILLHASLSYELVKMNENIFLKNSSPYKVVRQITSCEKC